MMEKENPDGKMEEDEAGIETSKTSTTTIGSQNTNTQTRPAGSVVGSPVSASSSLLPPAESGSSDESEDEGDNPGMAKTPKRYASVISEEAEVQGRKQSQQEAEEKRKKKRERRLAMNRRTARERRKRKSELIESLQEEVAHLKTENGKLKNANKSLHSRKVQLEHQLTDMRARASQAQAAATATTPLVWGQYPPLAAFTPVPVPVVLSPSATTRAGLGPGIPTTLNPVALQELQLQQQMHGGPLFLNNNMGGLGYAAALHPRAAIPDEHISRTRGTTERQRTRPRGRQDTMARHYPQEE